MNQTTPPTAMINACPAIEIDVRNPIVAGKSGQWEPRQTPVTPLIPFSPSTEKSAESLIATDGGLDATGAARATVPILQRAHRAAMMCRFGERRPAPSVRRPPIR